MTYNLRAHCNTQDPCQQYGAPAKTNAMKHDNEGYGRWNGCHTLHSDEWLRTCKCFMYERVLMGICKGAGFEVEWLFNACLQWGTAQSWVRESIIILRVEDFTTR